MKPNLLYAGIFLILLFSDINWDWLSPISNRIFFRLLTLLYSHTPLEPLEHRPSVFSFHRCRFLAWARSSPNDVYLHSAKTVRLQVALGSYCCLPCFATILQDKFHTCIEQLNFEVQVNVVCTPNIFQPGECTSGLIYPLLNVSILVNLGS